MTTPQPERPILPGNAGAKATEQVGLLEMSVRAGEATPEAAERWECRSDALAAWLLAELRATLNPRRPRGTGCPTASGSNTDDVV